MNIFNSAMKTAWLVLCAIGVASFLGFQQIPEYSHGAMLYINIIFLIVYPAVVILLISKAAARPAVEFGVKSTWGYIWRTTVIQYAALFPAGFACLFIFGKGPYTSIPVVLFLSGLHILISAVVTWAIFSTDRKAQLNWLFSLARGY